MEAWLAAFSEVIWRAWRWMAWIWVRTWSAMGVSFSSHEIAAMTMT